MKGLGTNTLSENRHVVRIVRITLEKDKRLVGLNFPPELMSDLQAVFHEKQQQVQSSSLTTNHDVMRSQQKIEHVTPINAKASASARKVPMTMKSFFRSTASFKSVSSQGSGGPKRSLALGPTDARAVTPNKTQKTNTWYSPTGPKTRAQTLAPGKLNMTSVIDLASSSEDEE